MKLTPLTTVLAISLLPAAGCLATDDAVGSETLASEDGHTGHNCPGPAPIMQVGDFDGDGTVTAADVDALSTFKDAGDYAAFYDMDADGDLDGRDVALVATNVGEPGTARDAQMAALWAATSPYRNIANAYAAGYVPFTPDLQGHGIHFANFDLIYSWGARGGFNAGQPEGLNYTAAGELVAAFYYAPAAVDLADYGYPVPQDMFYSALAVPPSFDGVMAHDWHNHVGACFGGATSPIPGFDQCMTQAECDAVAGQLWSPMFHMLHVWLFEYNECGPFAGIDADVSVGAPEEPNHMACELADVVHCVYMGTDEHGAPICMESDGGDHGHM